MPAAQSPVAAWVPAPLVAFGLWDAEESGLGNLYFFGRLASPVTIAGASQQLQFEPGEIQIRLT